MSGKSVKRTEISGAIFSEETGDKQELNRKLAEWAGFVAVEKLLKLEEGVFATWYWEKEGKKYLPEDLDFTQSLDACFKWLMPKLVNSDLHIEWYTTNEDTAITIKRATNTTSFACQVNPALALCLAIEKLIDRLS